MTNRRAWRGVGIIATIRQETKTNSGTDTCAVRRSATVSALVSLADVSPARISLLLPVVLSCLLTCTADERHAQATHVDAHSHTPSHTLESSPAASADIARSADESLDATADTISRLLRTAESHRFGIPLRSKQSASTSADEVRVRPSVHSYPQHASLQLSIQADRQIDVDAAIRLYEEAASLGSSQAINDIGEMHLYGEGHLTPNFTLATEYFQRSADLGHPSAQHNLALLRQLGLHTDGRPDDAMALLHDYFGSMGDNPLSKMSLGYRHLFGLGAPKSCESSVAYYQQVSESVIAQSLQSPINTVIEKARLSDDRSRSVPPEEDEDVIQFYQSSAENGDVGAQVALGHLHFYGARGFEQNPERAARYFKAAAAQGDTGAMSSLGQMHVQGLGVAQNNETAFEYLSQAAEKHNAAAQNGLGYLYLHGQGVSQDHRLALKWFKKSADAGFAEAQFNLGAMYFAGLGVEKKYQTALHHFTLAGRQGHTRALFNMAQMHLHGLGTLKACPIGVKLHKAVAERGHWAIVCNEAHRNFLKGRYEQAWMQYARAAEEGYEVAQANSAWMLDQGLGFSAVESVLEESRARRPAALASAAGATDAPPTTNLRYTLAHRHWTMAAQQGHIDSLRMLGDYAFDGVVSGTPDYAAAIKYYSQAAELHAVQPMAEHIEQRSAQAMFNLGYMHEHGFGLPAPDFHLAKRYYDSCLETDPDAIVPVKLALAKLYAKSYWLEWTSDASTASATSGGASAGSAAGPAAPVVAPLPGPLAWMQQQLALTGLTGWADRLWRSESLAEVLLAIEDVMLAILCAAFAVVVYYRAR